VASSAVFGGAGTGKTIVIQELIRNVASFISPSSCVPSREALAPAEHREAAMLGRHVADSAPG